MIIKIKSDRIITPDGVVSGYVGIENGKILCLTAENFSADICHDFSGKYVSPGFIDLHTHGAGGHAFLDSSVEDVLLGCEYHLRHGTTSILPTVSAAPFQRMRQAVINIHEAKHSGKSASHIIGAHLEGPYLSAAQCGAQCPDFITPPIPGDYQELVQQYGSSIARWTYAPENDPDGSFCAYLTQHGILTSAGHTDAKYPDMVRAIQNGCSLVTHLYSCTSTVTRDHGYRSLGVIESAFLRDELFVEIIADGSHLPKELVQLIVKIKGADKVALITDSLHIAGTGVTEGVMGGTAFIVEDGVCKLRDRSAFAGSVATADKLLSFAVQECGFDIAAAVSMLTAVPAGILDLPKGRIAAGMDADLAVFDESFNVTSVFVDGVHKEV